MKTEEIKEAAGKYAEEHSFMVPYDGSNDFYDDKDYQCSEQGFIEGVKWAVNNQWKDVFTKR